MIGAKQHATPQPDHEPDIHARLTKLKLNARRGLSTYALPITIPLTLLLGSIFLAMPYMLSSLALNSNSQILGLILITLAVLIAFGFIAYKGILKILTTRFKTHYYQTTWYLHKTDFPVLIANEQFWSRILEETRDMPILKWTGSPAPGSFEDCLMFGACYRRAICQCLSSKHLFPNNAKNPSGIALSSLRHGSCLYYLGTRHATALNWIVSLLSVLGCGCGFLGMALLPVLFTSASRDAERRGSLAAICDFFLDTCEVDVDQLPAPPGITLMHQPASQANTAGK